MAGVSPHKRDECGVAYQTTCISEDGPRRTGMMASVCFFFSPLPPIYGFYGLLFSLLPSVPPPLSPSHHFTFNSPVH